jgi:hypothetical protein
LKERHRKREAERNSERKRETETGIERVRERAQEELRRLYRSSALSLSLSHPPISLSTHYNLRSSSVSQSCSPFLSHRMLLYLIMASLV